jgi:hypothetical protein
VQNGSFEQPATPTSPSSWTGTKGTAYDTSGQNAVDGRATAAALAQALPVEEIAEADKWISDTIGVQAGEVLDVAVFAKTVNASSSPSVHVSFLNSAGAVMSTVNAITSSLSGTNAATQLIGQVTIPAGVTGLRIVLLGFAPTDLSRTGAVYFDDVWLWQP